ncbi:MAG: T9SS type B sorting domain-containing protein [Bacteroidetes bacterium]|nr:T9SS type B sorting domain-containing protein [Bacteroidota bacterium]
MKEFLPKIVLILGLFFILPAGMTAQPCECTNCPVPITDNGTFEGLLDVTVDGPNDLGQCPLQQVCFTITHTWVGDLSVSLVSPSGLNYLVMADSNNGSGGCGNSNDNIDVCIDVGTGNPLTNNTDYNCNGGPFNCLVGNWTAPCGGVTDPFAGAVQAPNCDLNDFNVPGDPANGTWTLVVNDICGQDVGFLETWNMTFACGVIACETVNCDANGGALNQPDVMGCQGDPGLSLNIQPSYAPGENVPPPGEYSYTFVVSQNGNIVNFIPGPDLNSLPPGTYTVCGLSYQTTDGPDLPPFIGGPFVDFQNTINTSTDPICGDLSTDCFTAMIGPPIPPTLQDTTICLGDCYTTPTGMECCTPGACEYTLQSYLGCDSTIIVNITTIPAQQTTVNETLCVDECLTIDGVDYCPPGAFTLEYTSAAGCDSIVFLNLLAVPVQAIIVPPQEITCTMPAVVLDGSFSNGSAYEWTDPNGMVIGNGPVVTVNQAGCYTLTVSNTLNGVTCEDTETVCVTANIDLPDAPTISGPTSLCEGEVGAYTILPDPEATFYDWTIPPGATVISGGDGAIGIAIDWTGTTGGEVCVLAANACGNGPETCITVTISPLPADPVINGPAEVCEGETAIFTTSPDPNTDSYNWSVPPGAIIESGQGTPSLEVTFPAGSSGQVCLSNSNACGSSMQACVPVNVIDLPLDPIVSGQTPVCAGQIIQYSTSPDPNTDSFSWTVPACANIVSGQGTNSITVSWDPGCTGGDVCVVASNSCGNTAPDCLTVTVDQVPQTPNITGSDIACVGETGTYSTTVEPGLSYAWTVSGGTISNGQGTSIIDVNWTTAGTGQVCLITSNDCGNSPEFCLDVDVQDVAPQPTINGLNIVCDGTVTDYSVVPDPSATGFVWTTTCGTITAGQGTEQITIDFSGCPTGGTICVTVQNDCGDNQPTCLDVAGGTSPETPTISGPDISCDMATETYCANTDPNISTYNWTVTGGTIVSGQGTECIDVSWDTAGDQQVCLIGSNGCGDSPETCFDVEVGEVPVAPAIDGFEFPCVDDTETYTATSLDTSVVDYTWTVSCGTIVGPSDGTSVEILWDNSSAGPCEVCVTANNSCGPGQQACYAVTVVDYPLVDAGMDDALCGLSYDLSALPGTGPGTWTASGPGNAVFDSETDAATTVTVDAYGTYTFNWTESSVQGNCESSDDVEITFNGDPMIDGAVLEACTADEQNYTVTIDIIGGQAPYTVTGTVPGTLTGNTFVSDLIASGTPYTFDIVDANGCGPLSITGQETCDCFTNAGTLDLTPIGVCEDEQVTIDLPGDIALDPDDVYEFVLHTDNGTNGNTLGTILDQNTSGEFNFIPGVMTPGETYYISVIAGNDDGNGSVDPTDDCYDVSQGVAVVWYAYPDPTAGPDDDACGLTYTLQAQADIGGSWFVSGGPGTASFDPVDDPNATVTVTEFGAYSFVWTEDNNGCQNSDEVLIIFNDSPTAAVTDESCDILNLNYTVTFEISGGLAPYTVSGDAGTLTGSTFVSDPIAAGTSYSFSVTDANGCGPFLVEGTVDCPCTTDVGTMDQTQVNVCADGTVIVDPTFGASLDPEDIIVYVLHNGSTDQIGTEVYGENSVPEFDLVPPMMENTVYYVSAVAGNDVDMDGVIDTDDPCVDVAAGTPVQWLSLPEVSFLGGDTVCEGETAEITLVVNSLECVDITVEYPDGSTETLTCLNDGDVIPVDMGTDSGTLSILDVVDANGCTGTAGATADITVNLIPTAEVTDQASICNSTDSGMSTLLDFNTLLTGGDTGGSWENTDNAPTTGAFPNLDFTGVTPGVYTFTYTTDSALDPCPESVYTVEVTVEDCACPSLELIPTSSLCNDDGVLDLSDLEITTAAGNWTIISTPAGANPATLTGTLFNASGADAGDYVVQFTLANDPPTGCETTNEATITVSQALDAGTPNGELEFCTDNSDLVVLADMLDGEDPNGSWTETSTQPSTGGAFNAAAGTFAVFGQEAGTYNFTYTLIPDAPCEASSATVSVVVNGLPVADAGEDFTLTCFDDVTELGGNSSTGPDITYQWTAAVGDFPGDAGLANPEITEPGVYSLLVTNEATGCTATDEVEIAANQESPMPFISLLPVSCYGDEDGAIIIDSVVGGQPPYMYSFNGSPYTQTLTYFNLEAATYTLQVQDANGCETEELTINIEQPQEVNVELIALVDGDNIIILGDSVDLVAQTSIDPDSLDLIQWQPEDLVSCDTCLITSASPLETTNFSITIESNGCADSDNLLLAVRKERDVYVPNVFSPNGDGDNDIFYIFGGSTVAKVNAFLVFDRWGETVHQYYNFLPNDPAYGWDGTHRGKPLNPGVFVWYAEIEYIDGVVEIIKGDVTISK